MKRKYILAINYTDSGLNFIRKVVKISSLEIIALLELEKQYHLNKLKFEDEGQLTRE